MASCGRCRAVVLILRAFCGQSWSRPAVAQSVCQARTIVTSTRTYSREPISSVQRKTPSMSGKDERISPSSGLTQRNLSAVAATASRDGQYRPHRRYDYLDLGEVDVNTKKAMKCPSSRRFILNPELARLVTDHLDVAYGKSVIFDCNPGPGVMTKSLLNSGAQRVVALEKDEVFLPDLHALENQLDGQLDVVQCDFSKLDTMPKSITKPSFMRSEKLFTDLGISEVPWSTDVPVKALAMLSRGDERTVLWHLVHSLFSRESIFRYGRIEILAFMSEVEYKKIFCKPGDNRIYGAYGVLWQIACDIELLHKEPRSSFVATRQFASKQKAKNSSLPVDNLCLVRMTPRKDLFTSILTPNNGATLVMMVKQCLAKRKYPLIGKLDSWCPGKGQELIGQMRMFEDVLTGQLYPDEYKRLFELMEQAGESNDSWQYEELLDNSRNNGFF